MKPSARINGIVGIGENGVESVPQITEIFNYKESRRRNCF